MADPWQLREGVLFWKVFASMQCFVGEIAEQQRSAKKGCHSDIPMAQHPITRQGDRCKHDYQPGREQNNPPISGAFIAHLSVSEEAVVIAGMALIKHLAETTFDVAQIFMNFVLTPVLKK